MFYHKELEDVKQYKKSKNEVYCGKILFGKYKRKNRLVTNPYEIKTLKLIQKLRDIEKLSYQKISDYLNNNNIHSKEKCQLFIISKECL